MGQHTPAEARCCTGGSTSNYGLVHGARERASRFRFCSVWPTLLRDPASLRSGRGQPRPPPMSCGGHASVPEPGASALHDCSHHVQCRPLGVFSHSRAGVFVPAAARMLEHREPLPCPSGEKGGWTLGCWRLALMSAARLEVVWSFQLSWNHRACRIVVGCGYG